MQQNLYWEADNRLAVLRPWKSSPVVRNPTHLGWAVTIPSPAYFSFVLSSSIQSVHTNTGTNNQSITSVMPRPRKDVPTLEAFPCPPTSEFSTNPVCPLKVCPLRMSPEYMRGMYGRMAAERSMTVRGSCEGKSVASVQWQALWVGLHRP